MSSFTRIQLEKWLAEKSIKADKVLDIGGSQLPITHRLKDWDVNEYKILDLNEPHENAKEPDIICDLNDRQENLPVNQSTSSDFCSYGDIEERQFNLAFCMEVTEYWWNPVQALENINSLLKEGGLLYISFHFIYPVHNPVDQDYLRYTPRGVEKLLEETGFEIIEHAHRTAEKLDINYTAQIEKMRPAKAYRNHQQIGSLIIAKKKK